MAHSVAYEAVLRALRIFQNDDDVDKIMQVFQDSEKLMNSPNFKDDPLSLDERTVLCVYAQQSPLVYKYTEALRSGDASQIAPFAFFHSLVQTALGKLPKESGTYYRGIKDAVILTNDGMSIMSTSTDPEVARNFMGPEGTMMKISATAAVDITRYSPYPEQERILTDSALVESDNEDEYDQVSLNPDQQKAKKKLWKKTVALAENDSTRWQPPGTFLPKAGGGGRASKGLGTFLNVPPNAPEVKSERTANTWNDFQHAMADLGLSKKDMVTLYYEQKGNINAKAQQPRGQTEAQRHADAHRQAAESQRRQEAEVQQRRAQAEAQRQAAEYQHYQRQAAQQHHGQYGMVMGQSAHAAPSSSMTFYKGGQFTPGGGRAQKGGVWM